MGEIREAVPDIDDITGVKEALEAKRSFEAVDLYPRDGTVRLAEGEARVASILEVGEDQVVLFGTGMAAVQSAIEVGFDRTDSLPVIARGEQLYSKSAALLGKYAMRRMAKVVSFDSGSAADTERVIERHQPDIIFCETVANGPDIPVLDHNALLAAASAQEKKPFVVLDNTLPLVTALPLHQQLKAYDNLLVVESGTKGFMRNSELLGLAYTNNHSLLHDLRLYRQTVGNNPGVGSQQRILSLLPESREAYDERNRRLYATTGALAFALYAAQQDGADFIVSHPSLPTHDNYELAAALYRDGCTPVLFLQCTGTADQFELAERLWQSKDVQQHAALSQSFGFDTTKIWPDEHARVVRIAGGANTDAPELAESLRAAALQTS